MKITPMLLGGMIACLPLCVSAQINPGDIAIIQVNNNSDGFTWVALKNITSLATATDSSWGATLGAGWRTTENYTTALPSTIAAGTIGFASMTTNLSNGGDQIFLFNKTSTNFTAGTTAAQAGFIFGINWDNTGWLTSGTYSTTHSYLPSTLSQHSLSLGSGNNWYYTGSTSGTAASLLSLIVNPQNWAISSDESVQFVDLRPSVSRVDVIPDDVTHFTAVPEPAAFKWASGAMGGLAILILRRRRIGNLATNKTLS